MTWEQHEAEYCKDIKPWASDIYDECDSYSDAHGAIHAYSSWEENNSTLHVVRWDGKYYVVHCNSNDADAYYQRI